MTRNGTCVLMVLLPWIAADFAWSRASISPPHADSVCVCLSLWTRLSSTVTLLLTVEYLAWKHLRCVQVPPTPTRTSASSLTSPPCSLGPTATPQLSRLLNFQDSYSIRQALSFLQPKLHQFDKLLCVCKTVPLVVTLSNQ